MPLLRLSALPRLCLSQSQLSASKLLIPAPASPGFLLPIYAHTPFPAPMPRSKSSARTPFLASAPCPPHPLFCPPPLPTCCSWFAFFVLLALCSVPPSCPCPSPLPWCPLPRVWEQALAHLPVRKAGTSLEKGQAEYAVLSAPDPNKDGFSQDSKNTSLA